MLFALMHKLDVLRVPDARSPICNRDIPENAINTHLDKGCQEVKPQNTKLAPLFTSQLGKRGTETRPSGSKTAKAGNRASSPDVVVLDNDTALSPPMKKRVKVEGNWAHVFRPNLLAQPPDPDRRQKWHLYSLDPFQRSTTPLG
jgi:hypothetical protein